MCVRDRKSDGVSVRSDPRWCPGASLQVLRARARLLRQLRSYFEQAGVLEVETPACSSAANSDPNIESFRCSAPGLDSTAERYLHTSPEFPMKRLLAAGSGPIYQICKVFRGGEMGRRHNPEFTLLEWYRPGFDHLRLMDEVAELVNRVLPQPLPVARYSYAGLFQERLGVDIDSADPQRLRACAIDQGVSGVEHLELGGVDPWLDLLMSHCIEPGLGQGELSFVTDYPASQAALARLSQGEPRRAQRFELYLQGMELANGFHELTAATEQRQRFEQDLALRRERGLPVHPLDEPFLAALEAGLPDCAGVALGVDRLLMLITGCEHIGQVLAFPWERA